MLRNELKKSLSDQNHPCNGCEYETYCEGKDGIGWSCRQYRSFVAMTRNKSDKPNLKYPKVPDKILYKWDTKY